MPNTKSAKKRLRQSEERRQRNKAVRSEIRTRMRKILEMDSPEQEGEARQALSELYAVLDRAAGRNVLHPNAAARRKAQAARHVEGLTAGG